MPNYKNAADVRAQHPGVYDDLTDQQIEQGLAQHAPTAAPGYETDATDPTGAKLSLTQDPARYVGHAAKGLAHSPIDLVKGLLGLPAQVLKGLTQDLPALIKDPSLLTEIPGAIKDTATYANTHPDEAGSLLGQMLLAPKVPGAVDATLAKGPSVVGRATSAVGRGMEAAGTSKLAKRGGTFGAMGEVLTGHPGAAALTAIAPPALEYGGKLLQKGGAALEGLDLAYKGRRPFSGSSAVADAADTGAADTVRETVRTAQEAKAGGASTKQASARAGWPLGKSSEVPYQAPTEAVNPDLFPYQKEALEAARTAKGDSAWAGDKSASPIDQFYENDPAARFGGEGRMTGQFEEGDGGLASIKSPIAELSRLSGRQVSPARMQELLKKFGGAGT